MQLKAQLDKTFSMFNLNMFANEQIKDKGKRIEFRYFTLFSEVG